MTHEFYLGIDVGKYQHQATLIDGQGTIIGQPFKFANERAGFNYLTATIKKQLPKEAVVTVGMEATGHYYWHLKDYFIDQSIPVKIFNPIETQTKAKTKIRKVKNDRLDSLLIAELTIQKQRNSACTESVLTEKEDLKQLRELTRFSEKLKSQARFYKQEISTLMERLCPEFSAHFSQCFLKTPLMIMEEYFLNNIPTEELEEKIVKTSKSRIKIDKAKEIVLMLNNSLGLNYRRENTQLQLKLLLQSLSLVEGQIKEVKEQIEKASLNFGEEMGYLTSIKGVSNYLASVVLGEIGDINKFSHKKKLTAFAGLDPSVKQSGQYTRQQGNHISKRGSKYLRKQLYYAAKTAVIFDPELKAFYKKKKAQGKHYNVIIIAVARKLLMRIYAVLKQKRLYELRPAT